MEAFVMESDVTALTSREALRIARQAACAQGYFVEDVIQSPYSVGPQRWRLELFVTRESSTTTT